MPATTTNNFLSPREVAELSGVSRRTVEKAIEEKVLPVHMRQSLAGKSGMRRMLGAESVVYTTLMRALAADLSLTLSGKRNLAKALKRHELAGMRHQTIEISPAVTADIGELAGDAIDRTEKYLATRDAWITSDPGIMGGLPIIRGTRIPVHSVLGWMRSGDSLDEIVADNYDLPREAFEAACMYAITHPFSGRPGIALASTA